MRRLQVAAREGRTWGVLWRRPGQRGNASAAPLRLALAPRAAPHFGQLAVHVLKRRGATLPQPMLIDVGRPGFNFASAIALPPRSCQYPSPRFASGTQ